MGYPRRVSVRGIHCVRGWELPRFAARNKRKRRWPAAQRCGVEFIDAIQGIFWGGVIDLGGLVRAWSTLIVNTMYSSGLP